MTKNKAARAVQEHYQERRQLFLGRVDHYSTEQWHAILDAYVACRHDDPLLAECRALFDRHTQRHPEPSHDGMLPEDQYGFLHGALVALGERAYRRSLLPFAEQMEKWADEQQLRDDYQHDLDKFRALLRDFAAWCDDPVSVGDNHGLFLHVRCVMDYGRGGWFAGPGDPECDELWACFEPLWWAAGDEDGGEDISDAGVTPLPGLPSKCNP